MWLNQVKKKEYFTDLYNQDFDYVYSYIFARTAGNSQLTEDIVQETFAAAWLSLNRFDQKSTSRTWFCSIAKNKLREYYRRTIYREKFELPGDDGLVEYEDSFDLEKVVFDNETRRCVLEVLGAINPLYRYVLIMKYIDELSVKEIAKILGRSAKAVDGILQRAKISFEKAYLKMEGCDCKHEQ
jgi:RNA polymerase sigma-70 factor (ECF subfamily)